jgi:hypothetical protein
MEELGIETARSGYAHSVEDAIRIVEGDGAGAVANPAASAPSAGVTSEAAQPLQAMQRGLSQYPERKRSGVATTGALRDGAVSTPASSPDSLGRRIPPSAKL